MKKQQIKKFLILTAVIASLWSCSLAGTGDTHDRDTSGGTLSLSIPLISPSFNPPEPAEGGQNPVFPSYSGSARAYGFAQQYQLTIDPNDGVTPAYEYSGSQTIDSAYYDITITVTLPAGTGYSAYIELFNTNVSTVTPTASGYSGTFDITDGEDTDVNIMAIPYSPTTMTINTEETASGLTSLYDTDIGDITATGSEFWYMIDGAPGTSTQITITHDTADEYASYAYVLVFNQDGYRLAELVSDGWYYFAETAVTEIDIQTTAGDDYYLCIFPITPGLQTQGEFGISYGEGISDDGYEDDDILVDATALPEDTVLTAVGMDQDVFTFTLADSGDIQLNCEYDYSQFSYSLYLLDSAGNTLYLSNEEYDDESITASLTAGTYYATVVPNLATITEYAISWSIE